MCSVCKLYCFLISLDYNQLICSWLMIFSLHLLIQWTNRTSFLDLLEVDYQLDRYYSNCFCSSTMLLSRGENNRGRVFHLSFAHLWLIYINLLGLVLSTGYAVLNSMFCNLQHIFVYIDPYKITSTDLTICAIVSLHED